MKKPEIISINRDSKVTVYEAVVAIKNGDEFNEYFGTEAEAFEYIIGEIDHNTPMERKNRLYSVRIKEADVAKLDDDDYLELIEKPVTIERIVNALCFIDEYPSDSNGYYVDPETKEKQ